MCKQLLTTLLNPHELVKTQDTEWCHLFTNLPHLFYRNMHFISEINLLIMHKLV